MIGEGCRSDRFKENIRLERKKMPMRKSNENRSGPMLKNHFDYLELAAQEFPLKIDPSRSSYFKIRPNSPIALGSVPKPTSGYVLLPQDGRF